MPSVNSTLSLLDGYASKEISLRAKSDPTIANLSIGEPEFGPPDFLREAFEEGQFGWNAFVQSTKAYEQSRGMPALREAIAAYYRRSGLIVDPDREILVTHGGVEAIALAILATSAGKILVTNPSYMLYRRAIATLGRQCQMLDRPVSVHEYADMFAGVGPDLYAGASAIIINSPENPTGYVLSSEDFAALESAVTRHDLWVIHDEVYDTMAYNRPHWPARARQGLRDRAIMVNSLSKKFGVPGLRIGWMCAPPAVIDVAAKLHDYLYLGVNISSEMAARAMLVDARSEEWLKAVSVKLRQRVGVVQEVLSANSGFTWPRRPLGGMFAFPNVETLARRLPQRYRSNQDDSGTSVARYLLDEVRVACIPGVVYGQGGADFIRLVLCSDDATFDTATTRLRTVAAAVN